MATASKDRSLRAARKDKNPKGIYEFLRGGEKQLPLLAIRLFDDRDKRVASDRQAKRATNLPNLTTLCATHDRAKGNR